MRGPWNSLRRFLSLPTHTRTFVRRPPIRQRLLLEPLECRLAPTVNLVNHFDGMSVSNGGGYVPPDTCGAVGPNSYVETVNSAVTIYNKSTGASIASDNMSDFLFTKGGITPIAGLFDATMCYDEVTGQFIIGDMDVAWPVNGGTAAALDIAVSKTSNPTTLDKSSWNFYQVTMTEANEDADYPGNFGFNADAFCFTYNMFDTNDNGGHVEVAAISQSSLAAGKSLTVNRFDENTFSLRPVTMHNSTVGGPMWFVAEHGNNASIDLFRVDNILTSHNTSQFTIAVNPYNSINAPLNPNGTAITTNIDTRIYKAAEANNEIVASQSVGVSNNEDDARWYEFNVSNKNSPTLVQQGNVGFGANTYTVYPAIDINSAGDIGMGFTKSGNDIGTDYMSTYVTGQVPTDPSGTMETPVEVKAGNSNNSDGREGDFSGINVDSDGSFWVADEYALSGSWGTEVAQFNFAQTQTTLTWTGGGTTSNWSDPNNWGGVTLVAGDSLVFGPGASAFNSTNDFAAGTSFNTITFTGTGYTVSGNSVVLTGGVDGSQATGNNSLTLGISLASNESIQGGSSGTTLTLGGAINNQGNTLTVAGGSGAVVIDNTISGSGKLIENNTGSLTLSGTTANTFTGLTTVQSGTLLLDKTGALALTGSLTVGTGAGTAVAQWLASNQLASAVAVTVGSLGTLDLNGNTNTVASLTLSGGTVQTEAGTLTLSGNVSASGASTLSGNLALTSGSHSFTVSSASTLTASANISGSASLSASGSGTLVLSGANTYSSGTKLSGGTLAVGNSSALGSGVLTVSGGTLSSSGGAQTLANAVTLASNLTIGNSSTLTFTGSVTLTGNRTLNVGTSAVATFTGVIAQSGTTAYSLTKSGGGTLTLLAANTYSGGTALSSGTLAVGNSGALGSGVLTVSGGTLSSSGGAQTLANAVTLSNSLTIGAASTLTLTGAVTLTGNRILTVNTGAVATFAGVIAQSGTTAYSLTKSGSGTLVLSAANTYTGGTKLNSGTLAVGNSAALGSGVLTLNGGTLSSSGGPQTLANAVTFSSSSSIGASSTLTLTGAVTLTGSRSLNIGTGAVATFAGAIGQSGGSYSFTKSGAGTLILSGSNTYTGNTFVNAGTLLVNGSLGGGTVNVANGAILGGSGTMGAVSVSSGGKLQPSAGGSPAILSTGSVTLNSGSTFSVALDGATPGAGGYDQLDASGNINLGSSTLNVSLGFTPTIGEAFTIIKNNGTNPISGTFKGLPEGSTFVSGGMTFQISYVGGSGHDVVLTRIA